MMSDFSTVKMKMLHFLVTMILMKWGGTMKKILSLLLIFVFLLGAFTGCVPEKKRPSRNQTDAIDKIPYTLNDDTLDTFRKLLEEAEALGKGSDLKKAEEAVKKLDDAYMDLVDQNQIAYVKYCLDQTVAETKEQYLYSEEVTNQAEADYNAMLKRVYLSESPIRDDLFADWTQEEIDMMLKYNDEIKDLQNRNSELTTEFRELKENDAWEQNMIRLYNEFVKNNNRIAVIYGYENYYTFANRMVYKRDYDAEKLSAMRSLVAQYLPDCHSASSEKFNEIYENLPRKKGALLSELIYDPYDTLAENYVLLYINDLPESTQQGMEDLFSGERSVFTDNRNAYAGAYTTFIDDAPFCFFGPDYYNSETVVHELGHYYGGKYADAWSQPMDLAETQSQGNEWLYMRFLQRFLEDDIYSCYTEYKMLSALGEAICFVMIDEFEEQVYTHPNAGNLTLQQYNGLMEKVAVNYGGIQYINESIMNIQAYWKYVVIESPVYYISYAVSSVAAIDLYMQAETDEAVARENYRKLVEECPEGAGFLECITLSGLRDPFEESFYRTLHSRYGK